MRPVINEPSRDSFDYVCFTCRDSIVISVSGSALASKYFELIDENPDTRVEIQADIRQYKGKNYPMFEENLAYFLRLVEDLNHRSYSFRDWESGHTGADLSCYTNIPAPDKELIQTSQKEIFAKSVDQSYNELISDLKIRSEKSINLTLLHNSEIKTVRQLLFGKNPKQEGIIRLGNWGLPYDEIKSIQEYHRDAVNGTLDLSTILSPNQKIRIGSIQKLNQLKINALAYYKYMEYLDDLMQPIKISKSAAGKEDSMVLLELVYIACQGSISNNRNLFELVKLLSWEKPKASNAAISLKKLGYIKMLNLDGDIELTELGKQKFEENIDSSSSDSEQFTKEEIQVINSKLDSILEAVEKLDVGHEVIFDEIDSLRNDAKKFSKKDFKSMAIGKLLSLGLDGLLDKNSISDFLHDLFGNDVNRYLK